MNQYIAAHKDALDSALDHLKDKFSSLRTGRASAELLDSIMVEAYGTKSPVSQMANISIADAKTIVVKPWDKSIMKDLEKAISDGLPNINPNNEGDIIRIVLPAMTEENRKDMVKLIKQRAEEERIVIRNIRDEIKDAIIKAEEAKEITEDERFRFIKELDDETNKYNEKIRAMTDKKEIEVMTI